MILPRQARDKHRENSKKARFLEGNGWVRNLSHGLPHTRVGLRDAAVESVDDEPVVLTAVDADELQIRQENGLFDRVYTETLRVIIMPRQAQDKHGKTHPKRNRFLTGTSHTGARCRSGARSTRSQSLAVGVVTSAAATEGFAFTPQSFWWCRLLQQKPRRARQQLLV